MTFEMMSVSMECEEIKAAYDFHLFVYAVILLPSRVSVVRRQHGTENWEHA